MSDETARERAVIDELRTTLARLELVSGAPTQAFDSSGGHSCEDPGGKRPGGDNCSPADYYRRRVQGVEKTERARLDGAVDEDAIERTRLWAAEQYGKILKAAQAELAQLTGRDGEAPAHRDAELDTAEGLANAVAEMAPGRPAKHVAERLGHTVFAVQRIYGDLGLDALDGSPVTSKLETPVQRILRLAEGGMTQKQIASLVDKSQPTVSRILTAHRERKAA